ncbi:hypothetical protein BH10CYA1_BH10CYA1_59870 [soil metagenome]
MKLPLAIENLLKKLSNRQVSSSDKRIQQIEPNRSTGQIDGAMDAVTARCYQNFVQDAASPLSQLILQLHVAGKKDASISAADVLIHVKRLLAILEQKGMATIGLPSQILPFDPNSHVSVDGSSYQTGLLVQVKFPGLAYRSAVVRKAAVEKQET